VRCKKVKVRASHTL